MGNFIVFCANFIVAGIETKDGTISVASAFSGHQQGNSVDPGLSLCFLFSKRSNRVKYHALFAQVDVS